MSSSTDSNCALVVISRRTPDSLRMGDDGMPIIDETDQANDALDRFNHPRERRARILLALNRYHHPSFNHDNNNNNQDDSNNDNNNISFQSPTQPASDLDSYAAVHSSGLLDFLMTAWQRWDALGESGQDPGCSMVTTTTGTTVTATTTSPPLIPICVPLPRDDAHQRPSTNVMGQVGYYCTDTCTPIFADLVEEMLWDAAVVADAVELVLQPQPVVTVVYALPTHPGHHAASDSFGGYCYVNHAALTAHLLSTSSPTTTTATRRVAVLDVDYHCGNGTASIFYDNPNILVVSIHCDPDFDYPFHSGFADETGAGEGTGATYHLPLPPLTSWKNGYQQALQQAMTKIVQEFQAEALVVSMGLDTHKDDPCAIRRAGFQLEGTDYWDMGQLIGQAIQENSTGPLPTVFLQEGGYKMDQIGNAAASVVVGYCAVFQ